MQSFNILANLCSWANWFKDYLIRDLKDGFSFDMAEMKYFTWWMKPLLRVCDWGYHSNQYLLESWRLWNFTASVWALVWPHGKCRGVPAYTQSTQLRTLIFEYPKNKNVLNREKCNKNMPHPGYRSLHYKYTDFVIILNQSNSILTVFHFCFGNN